MSTPYSAYLILISKEVISLRAVASVKEITLEAHPLVWPMEEFNSIQPALEFLGWSLTGDMRPLDGDGNELTL